MKPQHLLHCLLLALLSFSLTLGGCSENSLTFQIRFAEIAGLKQDDPVYFARNVIGRVGKVTYTREGDYLVEVAIAPGFTNAATAESRFSIGRDPASPPDMAVIVEQDHPGGAVLQEGTIVQGRARAGYFDQLLSDLKETAAVAEQELTSTLDELKKSLEATSGRLGRQLTATLDQLFSRFQTFKEELDKVPDSQEVRQLEESFRRFADEFHRAGKEVQERLRREILPQLRWELERLRDRLRKEGREDELEPIDRQVRELEMV